MRQKLSILSWFIPSFIVRTNGQTNSSYFWPINTIVFGQVCNGKCSGFNPIILSHLSAPPSLWHIETAPYHLSDWHVFDVFSYRYLFSNANDDLYDIKCVFIIVPNYKSMLIWMLGYLRCKNAHLKMIFFHYAFSIDLECNE